MRSALFAVLLVAFCACSACANEPSKSPTPSSTVPDPDRFLKTLTGAGIQLRDSSSATGYRDDASAVQYGQGICDLVRRKGPFYDPVPVIQLDNTHLDNKMSEESARIVYTAARENLCPDVAAYEPTATPSPTANTIPGEGRFRVGAEVQPGTYISQPVVTGQVCVWSRSRDVSASADAVIDQGVEGGSVQVTILPTDVVFGTTNCQTWRKVG
jgi:Protein of unknown function (DUF732)